MARLFNEHIVRQVQSLDGAWHFCADRKDQGETEGWEKGIPSARTVAVPSVWNCESGLLDYEGAAWYEKKFASAGGTLRFCFGAVMTAYEGTNLEFDCTELNFIDSTTLGTFVKILKTVKSNGKTMKLCALQSKIKKLFLICSLDSIMEIA